MIITIFVVLIKKYIVKVKKFAYERSKCLSFFIIVLFNKQIVIILLFVLNKRKRYDRDTF